jgi:uncharacterized membrane protein YfcA
MAFPGITIILSLLAAGILVGGISGMVGIGGGTLVIPILMVGFGFTQAKANGTNLAMLLPPIGIFAVLSYWRAGSVDLVYAVLLAIGFAVGAYFGALAVTSGKVSPGVLRVMFALLLLYVAGRMLLRPGHHTRAAIEAAVVCGIGLVVYAMQWMRGKKPANRLQLSSEYQKRKVTSVDYDYEI